MFVFRCAYSQSLRLPPSSPLSPPPYVTSSSSPYPSSSTVLPLPPRLPISLLLPHPSFIFISPHPPLSRPLYIRSEEEVVTGQVIIELQVMLGVT